MTYMQRQRLERIERGVNFALDLSMYIAIVVGFAFLDLIVGIKLGII